MTTSTRKGRPTDCKPAIVDRITTALRTSGNATLAAQHGPVSLRTFHNWRARGERDLTLIAAALELEADDIDPGHYNPTEWPYVHFLHETRKALNDFQLHLLSLVRQAGEGTTVTKTTTKTVRHADGSVETTTTETTGLVKHWQANAWMLERTLPDQYGRVSRHEHTGAGGGPIEVTDPTIVREKAESVLDSVGERLAEAGVNN